MPGNGWKPRLWLAAGWLALLGLGRLGHALHVGAWLDALPFAQQVLAKIALVLLATVVPFAVWVAVMTVRTRRTSGVRGTDVI